MVQYEYTSSGSGVNGPSPGDVLPKLTVFRQLPAADVRKLLALTGFVHFPADTVVYRQGQPMTEEALLIVTGRLGVSVESGGATRNLGDIWPGEFVGEGGLFHGGHTRSATVVASVPTDCLRVSRDLLVAGGGEPAMLALEQHLIETMLKRIRNANTVLLRVLQEQATAAAAAKARADRPRPAPSATRSGPEVAPDDAPPLTLAQRLARWFGGAF
jgi:CRP-like cAMP-binding protein